MIKRQFYKLEHANRDEASDSSSSSDSELEAKAIEESEDDAVAEVKEDNESFSTSPGLPISNDDAETGNEREILTDSQLSGQRGSETLETQSKIAAEKESLPADIPACILKRKSVFKCRICPGIICLNEGTLRDHIKSKRHTRSEKLLNEGKLTAMLNSDGELENQETAAEMNARILALPLGNKKRKNRKRQREQKRKTDKDPENEREKQRVIKKGKTEKDTEQKRKTDKDPENKREKTKKKMG